MSDEPWKFFGFTVITWCHQATSHYLSQCWPRSVSPYGITRLQWVKIAATFPMDHCIFMVSEFKELQDQLSDYKVVRYIPSDKDLKTLKDGGVAVIDQWICTHARWGNNSQVNIKIALDPCLIYDTDRYGWIWGSLCACAPARRHCRRLQPIAIGYSRPSSWPERSHAGMATKISDYGCSGLDRANTWTNSVLICDLWICHEMRYSLYVRRNARFFHLYENVKLQDRLISLTH